MADRAKGSLIAGKYRVEGVIAEAMTTTTYVCSFGGRRHFVKTLRSIVADDREDRGRFEREYQVLRSLRHPCIASVSGLEMDDGIPCIVMEFLEGETLKALIEKGPLDIRAAVGILLQLLGALQAAHAQGIIHRDLEPANLFTILRSEGSWQLKIFNFGAARTADAATARGAGLTQAGTILGNTEYMSPEQARGDALDGRSDLYSVGCLAYAMLTGAPPFAGAGQIALVRHATEAPRPLRPQRPDIPQTIERWVMQALAKRPDSRFKDAAEARDVLYAAMPQSGAARTPTPVAMQAVSAGRAPTPVSMPAASSGRTPAPVAVPPASSGRVSIPPGSCKVLTQNEMRWEVPVGGLPKNARMSVISGNPTRAGLFTVRLLMPGGFRILPHTHSSEEQVTVIAGAIKVGEGRVLAADRSRRLTAGGFYLNPPGALHFAWSDEECLLHVTGTGPWDFKFV